MKLEDLKAYCIHLKRRKDREDNMYKELDYFVPNQYIILEAEGHPIGKIGVSRSFKKAITNAKEKGLEYVLIFEDDVRFTSNKSREAFQEAIDSLPNDWDILLGGIYADTNLFDCNDKLKRVESFSALHCTLIRDSAYDYILEHKEQGKHTVHLDTYLGNLSKEGELNVYLAYPMIAIQYEGKSNTANRIVDYTRFLGKYEILK